MTDLASSEGRRWADVHETAAYYRCSVAQIRKIRLHSLLPSYMGPTGRVLFDLDECDAIVLAARRGPAVPEHLPRIPMGERGGSCSEPMAAAL